MNYILFVYPIAYEEQRCRTQEAGYLRLKLGNENSVLQYLYIRTEDDLQELIGMTDRTTVYVLFNNLSMLHDTKRFQHLIAPR
jgi:uncharacterized protein YecE (DUF72 family)